MKIRSDIRKNIATLYEIADELRKGKFFQITRLTRIKRLCASSEAAEKFSLFILREKLNEIIEDKDKAERRKLLEFIINSIELYVENKDEAHKQELFKLLIDTKSKNDEYRKISWSMVRIINNSEAYYSELALSCILYDHRSSDIAYQLAREYAERYNPSYSTGLIPESAPFVESLANFWKSYYFC